MHASRVSQTHDSWTHNTLFIAYSINTYLSELIVKNHEASGV